MTPGCRAAPGVFFVSPRRQMGDKFAADLDCSLWRGGDAGAVWVAGICTGARGGNLPVWHSAHQSERVLFTRAYRTVDAESPDDFRGLAHGHRGGIFRRVHDFFQLRVGDGEDAGGWGVAAGPYFTGWQRAALLSFVVFRDVDCEQD